MKKLNGHWFCDYCDDIVFMSYHGVTERNVTCPSCGHLACNFIPAKLSREVLPADWFDKMRQVAGEDGTGDLPTQK